MVVSEDLFDVARRIREISPEYFVVFNEKKGKYELHSHYVLPTYVLTFPFDSLDARAVEHTLRTRAVNADRLIEEIERSNLALERQKADEEREKLYSALDERASEIL